VLAAIKAPFAYTLALLTLVSITFAEANAAFACINEALAVFQAIVPFIIVKAKFALSKAPLA